MRTIKLISDGKGVRIILNFTPPWIWFHCCNIQPLSMHITTLTNNLINDSLTIIVITIYFGSNAHDYNVVIEILPWANAFVRSA